MSTDWRKEQEKIDRLIRHPDEHATWVNSLFAEQYKAKAIVHTSQGEFQKAYSDRLWYDFFIKKARK
jgi:hypothetical protein